KEAQVIKIEDDDGTQDFAGMTLNTNAGVKRIMVESPSIMANNAIEDELNDFYKSVRMDLPVHVTIEDGYKALKIAQIIEEKISGR
ncbi:MAG TPA: hypothetical protein PK611_06520, partial [Saprospiraceae bacterium]|nr:hypothetical protein [Saprospiraceae bacterium]